MRITIEMPDADLRTATTTTTSGPYSIGATANAADGAMNGGAARLGGAFAGALPGASDDALAMRAMHAIDGGGAPAGELENGRLAAMDADAMDGGAAPTG